MKISIIIPTLNEERHLGRLLERVCQEDERIEEVIVVDGGSDDLTREIARTRPVKLLRSRVASRSAQMNMGAKLAKGDVFYFIHADTIPPATFPDDIEKGIQEGYDLGRYYSRYTHCPFIMKLNAWVTQFDFKMAQGGDQTLFIKRKLFEEVGRFDEDWPIFEDYELVKAARKIGKYLIMKKRVLISARKYDHNSWWRVNKTNFKVFKMYERGVGPAELKRWYFENLQHPKGKQCQ